MPQQLLNSEIVLLGKIGDEKLPLLNVAGVPEPEIDNQTYSVPLKQGKRSAGGLVSYGSIEAWKVYNPDEDEAHKARMQAKQGANETGPGAFHQAPGNVVRQTPIAGESYELVFLRCWLSDGQNSDGDAVTNLNYEFGVNGVPK